MSAETKQQNEQQAFSADVSRLLDIVAHALYTNHDVFLRELISNSADACDRLRYNAIQNSDLIKDNPDFRICVYKDTTSRTVTIVDNGIGMDKEELSENLGTIAKSGTRAIMETMDAAKETDGKADKLKLIGQFGVGFYAGYMVANTIEVVSHKAGSNQTFTWKSDGKSGYTITESTQIEKDRLDGARGTAITLHIKDEACEFLIDDKITQTVKEYSDHISVPIFLGAPKLVSEDKEAQAINEASALWMKQKNDINKEEYNEFYHHVSGSFDEPVLTCHWKAEGAIEFTSLLYIPELRPWDLFDPSRRSFVKLYVRRVFITEDLEALMYPWLRFVRGVIDSEDLPLNISRETLQYNPTIEKIKNAVARKILGDLHKLSQNDAAAFATFWGQFGPAIKEGLYDAPEHRDGLLKICRFYSSHDNGTKLQSLEDYTERMKEEQNEIYYISGESLDSLKNSPQLEGFKSRGLEVLFFTDTIDDFWLQSVLDYKGKNFKSITKGDIEFEKFENKEDNKNEDEPKEDENKTIFPLIEKMQNILKDHVHNVRISKRLTDSPVCLVAPDGGVDMYMERVLRLHQKYEQEDNKPVLEINPTHTLIKKLSETQDDKKIEDTSFLLLDQAKIIQGENIDDPTSFARRMSDYMAKAL